MGKRKNRNRVPVGDGTNFSSDALSGEQIVTAFPPAVSPRKSPSISTLPPIVPWDSDFSTLVPALMIDL
jgi:hypothetical protein